MYVYIYIWSGKNFPTKWVYRNLNMFARKTALQQKLQLDTASVPPWLQALLFHVYKVG